VKGRTGSGAGVQEGRKCSFLKKRTKKLLFLSGGAGAAYLGLSLGATDKSFLVLFFKKEPSFLPARRRL
jgi:hypothetical protein